MEATRFHFTGEFSKTWVIKCISGERSLKDVGGKQFQKLTKRNNRLSGYAADEMSRNICCLVVSGRLLVLLALGTEKPICTTCALLLLTLKRIFVGTKFVSKLLPHIIFYEVEAATLNSSNHSSAGCLRFPTSENYLKSKLKVVGAKHVGCGSGNLPSKES